MGATAAVITAERAKPLMDAVQANVGVMLPIGFGIMGIMVGIKVVPKIVYSFF